MWWGQLFLILGVVVVSWLYLWLECGGWLYLWLGEEKKREDYFLSGSLYYFIVLYIKIKTEIYGKL